MLDHSNPFRFGLLLALSFSALLLSIAAISYCLAQASSEKSPQHNAANLDRLVKDKDYPELERELPDAKLDPAERSYFAGILAARQHRVTEAIAKLEQVLPGLRKTNHHRAANALRTLAYDYFECGRYADASRALQDTLQHFAAEFTAAERRSLKDDTQTFSLLNGAPAQAISGPRTFTVPVQRDVIGDIDVPLQLAEKKQWWIFDTGANISTITLSTARNLGLKLSEGHATTQGGATGTEVPLRTAVIPEVHFGDAVIHNVIALVLEDKELDIDLGKNGHYKIQGILGYPVLTALGTFSVRNADAITPEMTVTATSEVTASSTPLYVDELTLLLEAKVNGRNLLFSFDTGSSSAELTARYAHQFPSQFAGLRPKNASFAGAGGVRLLPAYALPQVSLQMGSAVAVLKNVTVVAQPKGVEPLDRVFGNLGQGLLNKFHDYTIDFSKMRLTLRESVK